MKNRFFEFGHFRLDTQEGILFGVDKRHPLTPKEQAVLELLVRNPGRLLTKDEILKTVWGETIVDEANLSVQISALRKLLGDSASEPQYIETVPRRGYKFVASVRTPPPVESAPASPPPRVEPPQDRVRKPIGLGVAAVAVVAAGAAVWRGIDRPGLDWRPVPFTSKVGRETSPAISPDGTQIVYSYWTRTPDGQTDLDQAGLRLQAVGSAEPVRLTTQPDANPAWSPNGKEIAFIRFSDTITEVELVLRPAFGGAERVLRKLDYAGPLPGPYVSFSPDGKWILASTGSGGSGRTPLRRLIAVNRDTGETQDLLPAVPGTSGDLNPVLSPSGKRLAFCRCSFTSSCDLYEVAMDQLRPLGAPRRLTRSVSSEFRSAFLPDESLVYSLGPPNAHALWRVSFDWRNQPRHEMLSPATDDAMEPSIAWGGDGTIRVIYTQNRLDSNIWRLNLQRPDGPPLAAAPVIASTAADEFPAYSPDSSKIAFTSTRSGSWELWTCAANGADCNQRSDLGAGYRRNPAWAMDGKSIVFDSTVDGATQLYQADLAAGSVRQLTQGGSWNVEPAFAPDGKWLYFASNRSGRFEIYRTAVGPSLDPRDRAIPVTRQGGASPRITPDGADLVYRALDRSYVRLNLATGRATNLLELSCVSPTPAPNGFVYGFLNEGLKGYLVRIQGAKYERLHRALLGRANSLARSPDGASLSYVQTDRNEADLMMVRIPRM